jgi:hypothetical protein
VSAVLSDLGSDGLAVEEGSGALFSR